jgi:Protein of unknown function (DUF3152)
MTGRGAVRLALGLLAIAVLALVGAPAAAHRAAPAAAVYRYEVAVRGGVHLDLETFATEVGGVLGDPRGWSLAGAITFERVAQGGDFSVWLATPDQMRSFARVCSPSYSCRAGRHVVVNERRWLEGASGWHGALADYRRYVVNHEVGHWLGESHRTCPGNGLPAPVMLQQSKSLAGCLPQAWPLADELAAVRARHVPGGSGRRRARAALRAGRPPGNRAA